MFKANVSRVEIVTHAKCNRICSFCPNVIMDRRLNNSLTDRAMLDRIFGELGSIDYRRQICVARYSEPLANRDYLYGCLASARERVPHAELAITTNTDYLTQSVLDLGGHLKTGQSGTPQNRPVERVQDSHIFTSIATVSARVF